MNLNESLDKIILTGTVRLEATILVVLLKPVPAGGTGRRAGLKIRWPQGLVDSAYVPESVRVCKS